MMRVSGVGTLLLLYAGPTVCVGRPMLGGGRRRTQPSQQADDFTMPVTGI